MKALKKVLILDRDGRSLSPLFRALFQNIVDSDQVLTLAGVTIESAGISFSDDVVEGKKVKQQVVNALTALGLPCPTQESKDIKNHKDLLSSSDLVIVPDLFVEDVLCPAFDDSWSKMLNLEDSIPLVKNTSFSLPDPATVEDYVNWAQWVRPKLVPVADMLKNTYLQAAIVRGISRTGGIASGEAHIARHSKDLVGFRRGSILVIDRAGVQMFKDITPQIAEDIINGIDPSVLAGSHMFDVLAVVLSHSSGVVCSRGDQYMTHAYQHKIPVLTHCVGGTDHISTGQRIVIDAESGTVYDVSLLQRLS